MSRQPSLGDFYELSADTIRTEYIKAKAARIVDARGRAVPLPQQSTKTTLVFLVAGDHRMYMVWLRPYTSPWTVACSRGGVHDMQPEGRACAHGLAAAVAYELAREAVRS